VFAALVTFQGMKFVMYPQLAASDVARARDWYWEKLGIEPVIANQEPYRAGQELDRDTELFYDTGTAKFGVYRSDNAGSNLATAVRLVVEDFDAAHSELVSRGVVFEDYHLDEEFRTEFGVLVSPDGEKTCWFKDSEGNILAMGSSI
jgi:catechol 2,3-dioxygenase-like lactoylglutathione lyase family enzyme